VRNHRPIEDTKPVEADTPVGGAARLKWVAQLEPRQARGKNARAGAEPGVDEAICSQALDDDAIQPGPCERHPEGEDVASAYPDEVRAAEGSADARGVVLAQVEIGSLQPEGSKGLDLPLGVGTAPVLVETVERVSYHPTTPIAAHKSREHFRMGAQLVGRQVQPHLHILPARPVMQAGLVRIHRPSYGKRREPTVSQNGLVSMSLPPGEPSVEHWDAVGRAEFVDLVRTAGGSPIARPQIVGVDGRGAAGKSTLATWLHKAVPASAVLHTDDLAWNEPFFAWGHLLLQVLQQLHRGEPVHLRPPAWRGHGRQGEIHLPAGLDLVVVEGVGASQREHADLIDVTVWVQSDFDEAERRGIARDIAQGVNGDHEETVAFWHEWMGHELLFVQQQRPWERAALVVAGTAVLPLEPGQVAVSPGPL